MAIRIYKTPFAATGDVEPLSDVDLGTGKVSLPTGFTPDYEKPDTDPNYKPVGREETNGIFNEITESLGQVQQYGFAFWQSITGGWPIGANVNHGGGVWQSLANANTEEPGTGPLWKLITFDSIGQSTESVLGLVKIATTAQSRTLTADDVALTPKKLGIGIDSILHPSMTGSITLNGTTDNTVAMTDIVTELSLEVGDVVRIDTGAYNKLHTVESITDNDTIVVNYEHAGNRADGSLKLPDFTGQATVTRIAKWFNAPSGLGQAWVDVKEKRSMGAYYTNTTNRLISVFRITSSSESSLSLSPDGGTTDLPTAPEGAQTSPFSYQVPHGWSHRTNAGGSFRLFWELR